MESNDKSALAPAEGAKLEAVAQECRALRTQFLAVLILLMVMCVSVNLLLYKAQRVTHRQVDEMNVVVDQTITGFNANARPRISDIIVKLREFGQTHPDFNSVLAKYSIQQTNVPAPAAPPAKAPTPKGP